MVQAVIMAGLFATSLAVVQRSGLKKDSTGLRVMSVALLLLTIDFLHYLPVFGARKGLLGLTVPGGYLKYTSIFDLILEILLGFGTVIVLMEAVRRELEAANKQLVQAHDKLELMAQMDPLTEALNRHAFHSLLRRNENQLQSSVSGCVAVIDIDNLKPINDSFGHNVGDKAIRAVARAVRSLIRADDMLFRWGGDEFLIIMFNLPVEQAGRRMESLNQILEQNGAQWTAAEVKVAVSFGMAGFDSLTELANAIELADKAMYSKRNYTRGSDKQMVTV
jgi:diguanylate cyclase (GGDEF)-like protein